MVKYCFLSLFYKYKNVKTYSCISLWLTGSNPRYRYKHILITSSDQASGINSVNNNVSLVAMIYQNVS